MTDFSDETKVVDTMKQYYALVLFFFDMNNLRSWKVVQNAIARYSASFTLMQSVAVINNCKFRSLTLIRSQSSQKACF